MKENNGFCRSFLKIAIPLIFTAILLLFSKLQTNDFSVNEPVQIKHLNGSSSKIPNNTFNFDHFLAEICENEGERFAENRYNSSPQFQNSYNFPIYKLSTLAVAQLFSLQQFLATDLRILHCSFLL